MITWKPTKVGRGDLVLCYDQGSLVRLCVQDYTRVCALVTICAPYLIQIWIYIFDPCDLEK